MNVVPGTVFVKPLNPEEAGVVEVEGLIVLNGASPVLEDGLLKAVPGLIVLVCVVGGGDAPMIPAEGGFPTIAPGAAIPGVELTPGAALTPPAPLVSPVADPEDVPEGVEAAPAAVGVAGCTPVVP